MGNRGFEVATLKQTYGLVAQKWCAAFPALPVVAGEPPGPCRAIPVEPLSPNGEVLPRSRLSWARKEEWDLSCE